MENEAIILKAIADETRLKIVRLLLKHNLCVGALSRRLGLTEAAISQHLKVLREAGLITGEKRGYFMHYEVNRDVLQKLSVHFKELAEMEREICDPNKADCAATHKKPCYSGKSGKDCSAEVKECCHGTEIEETEDNGHGHCKCHKS